MKKNLARIVTLGLICTSVFTENCCAINKTLVVDDTSTILTFVEPYYEIDDTGEAVRISGINDKSIKLEQNSSSSGNSLLINAIAPNATAVLNESYGITNIDSNATLNIVSYGTNGANGKAILNQHGNLIFSNKVYINGLIENNRGATLEFKNDVDIMAKNENNTGEFACIVNDGILNVNNDAKLSVRAYTSVGSMFSFYGNYSSLNAIDNRGTLDINADQILGNIKHNTGSITKISLSSVGKYTDTSGRFFGNVLESDANFSLIINENTLWAPRHQIGEVEGITLNKGFIFLSADNYTLNINNEPVYSWNSDFDTLRLKNVRGSAAQLDLSTDLANNIGDKLIFTGSIPDDFNLGVFIFNKDDNNGVPIKREDGHSVTIISAPSDAKLNVGAALGFYGKNDLTLYDPLIDEIVEGNVRNWNFVGWQAGGTKTVDSEGKQGKDALDLHATELENTLKRINDIRTDPSEVGAWLRGENGKMKIRSYGYKYNLMSGGYDWKYESDAAKMFLGFGISYAKNNCDTGIIGDTKSMGYNLYGSWLGRENNDYVDVIVKYGTLDKKYAGLDDNNVFVTGDYDKKLFSVAAKYGRRITRDDDWYYEPSVGLTWGRIGSADFNDSQGIKIHADSSTTKMATLGMQVGKNIQGTEFYGLFQVRHDFDGKMHVSVPGSDLPGSSVYDDMGGTWYKVGIGAARKINKNNSFYMDIEKDFGNKVKKPYAIGAGYRYTF